MHDVWTAAGLATFMCPLVTRRFAVDPRAVRETARKINDSTGRIILNDVTGISYEVLAVTVAGSPRGPTGVSIAYPIDAAVSDTANATCSQRIFAAIDDLVARLHIGDTTVLASQPVMLGPEPKPFTVAGGIPTQGPRIELTVTPMTRASSSGPSTTPDRMDSRCTRWTEPR